MSSLSMTEAKLPPGFRFHPRDEELISDYLAMKVSGDPGSGFSAMMIDVDLNSCEPWDLPAMARVGGKEWYFYSRRDRKYTTGRRANRATASGYWKATGIDRPVVDPRRGGLVGMRKTLVFYHGRAPTGKKTDWVMHEFRTDGPAGTPEFSSKDWVLCRVFHKGGGSPTRHNTENCDDHTGPSSLTSLLDSFISFEQSQLSHEGRQQVPCFSDHSPSRQPRRWSSPATLNVSTAQGNVPATVESLACPGDMVGLGAYLQPLSYEKKAIGAVPGHLSMLDGNLNTEGRSSIHLGETWVPHMGNHPF